MGNLTLAGLKDFVIAKKILLYAIVCICFFTNNVFAQRGKDGNHTLSISNAVSIVNRYTPLAANCSVGDIFVQVANVLDLNGVSPMTNAANLYNTNNLSVGDGILIVQMQGADINIAQNITFGKVTNYRSAGLYEFAVVAAVSGNVIQLCGGLKNSYMTGTNNRAQVIRFPRLNNLTLSNNQSIIGAQWNGTTGGVVCLEVNNVLSVSNSEISAAAIGFRGGGVINATAYAETDFYSGPQIGGAKGESIFGNETDYTAGGFLFGKGALANGGGGGNGHNNGGGGGSNAAALGDTTNYNGTGVKPNDVANWADAWTLEAAGFGSNISPGGGRGGYSFANSYQNPLTIGPGSNLWGGDFRRNNGGLGGYPLLYQATENRLFMGGGGGAGDGNNNSAGNGGRGGGIVIILNYGSVLASGSASVSANGQKGFDTYFEHRDAAGGGGGGGAILIYSANPVNNLSVNAAGGNGGNQDYPIGNDYKTAEIEGPGGGGGGGYVIFSALGIVPNVSGGQSGTSNSDLIVAFIPNGTTSGNTGYTENRNIAIDLQTCGILDNSANFLLALSQNALRVKLNWTHSNNQNVSKFLIERSDNKVDFYQIGELTSLVNNAGVFSFEDPQRINNRAVWYRVRSVQANGEAYLSNTVFNNKKNTTSQIEIYPNPASDQFEISLPNMESGIVTINLVDRLGRTVKQLQEKYVSGTATNIRVDAKGLQPGLYFISVKYGNEIIARKLLIE